MGNYFETFKRTSHPREKKNKNYQYRDGKPRRFMDPLDSASSIACHGNGANNMHECLRNHDVLICIFKHLPRTDRKNVRHTCKLWMEVCSTLSITKEEKLVLRPNCSISEIADLLRNLTFERIHLEFQNQPIARIPNVVWEICGSRISSLHFYHCHDFDQYSLRMMIEHCENLCDINIHESGSPLDCATLDYLIENKIERKMLSSFSLRYANDEYLDAGLLRRIFIVFPKIQNFTTGNARAIPIPEFKDVETSVPPESLTQLKSLVYSYSECFNGEHWLRAPMIPISKLRLKKFETRLNYLADAECINYSLKKTLFEFIEAQGELEIINLRTELGSGSVVWPRCVEWDLFIKELIFHVLDRCHNLREFRLVDYSYVFLSEEETVHFFARVAKLKCLTLECCFYIRSEFALSASRRFAIDTLLMKSDMEEFETCKIILGQCSLKHLRMGELWDKLFEEILTTQPDLRTLVLDRIYDCIVSSDSVFHNLVKRDRRRGYPISALRRLEYLEIKECEPCKFTRKMANEIRFPLLKHLKIYFNCDNILQKLSQIAPTNVPALEVLELTTLALGKWTDIIGVCRLLRNLRRLCVYSVEEHRSVELLQLFRECSNLRCVIKGITSEVFLFNPFTEEISESSLNGVRFSRINDIFDG